MCFCKFREVFTVSILLISTACSEVSPCYDDRGNAISCREEVDMSPDQDMSADMELVRDQGDEQEEACIPRTVEAVCASTCGVVSDGCDGMVQCEPCACEGGVPAQPVCGACGLGRSVCDEDQEVTCVYPGDIPVDTFSCDQIVYVDPKEPMGGGTKEMPFNSYAAALQSFAADETGVIVMSEGVLNEPLVLKSGVHVMAGYQNDSTGWVRDDQAQVVFKPASSPDENEDTFGMIATEIMRPTIVYGVQIEAPDAPPEKTSYGAYIKDATFLTLDHVLIKAGRGGAGRPGQDGADGADGGRGGAPHCMPDQIPGLNAVHNKPLGGRGGENAQCPDANGGRGGYGATHNQAGAIKAHAGQNSADGKAMGGVAGDLNNSTSTLNTGGDGENGPLVMSDIRHGERGQASWNLEEDRWVNQGRGSSGTDGVHGSGGGGGGGAGDDRQWAWTVGGGGGGAGGCGGKHGQGGGTGGASIGALVVRSNMTLENSTIQAQSGGKGGRGGVGGDGGQGGSGESGSFMACDFEPIMLKWRSGHGGRGSGGSNGGDGGGGAGGASFGVLCEEGALTSRSSEISFNEGGQGGESSHPGEDGPSTGLVNCE